MFPSINSFSRLCLHALVKDNYPDLTTFSVGAEKERRPVVCHQRTVAEYALENNLQISPMPQARSAPEPIVEKEAQVLANVESSRVIASEKLSNGKKSKTHKRPDRAVYVPPGANRRLGPGAAQIQSPSQVHPTLVVNHYVML